MTYQRQIGDKGEQIASDYLTALGYEVIDRNYTSRFGELDLVAIDGEELVFIEVKTRTTDTFGLPEEAITPAKLEKIQSAGLIWLQEHPEAPDDWRVEVVAIILNSSHQTREIQLFSGDLI